MSTHHSKRHANTAGRASGKSRRAAQISAITPGGLLKEKGEALYESLRETLERTSLGKVVAIDVDSGDHFVGDDELAADDAASAARPGRAFYFRWIGVVRVPTRLSLG